MDGRIAELSRKMEESLKEAAEIAAELQSIEQSRVPHYSQIELAAHETGRRLARLIQSRRAKEVAAQSSSQACCPDCGSPIELDTKRRNLESIDGQVDLLEPVGHCNRCRRSFFPSAGLTGAQ